MLAITIIVVVLSLKINSDDPTSLIGKQRKTAHERIWEAIARKFEGKSGEHVTQAKERRGRGRNISRWKIKQYFLNALVVASKIEIVLAPSV